MVKFILNLTSIRIEILITKLYEIQLVQLKLKKIFNSLVLEKNSVP